MLGLGGRLVSASWLEVEDKQRLVQRLGSASWLDGVDWQRPAERQEQGGMEMGLEQGEVVEDFVC